MNKVGWKRLSRLEIASQIEALSVLRTEDREGKPSVDTKSPYPSPHTIDTFYLIHNEFGPIYFGDVFVDGSEVAFQDKKKNTRKKLKSNGRFKPKSFSSRFLGSC
jgi:hypothetical protein